MAYLNGQADANTGHAFGILMACVGALRTFGAPAPLTLGVRPMNSLQCQRCEDLQSVRRIRSLGDLTRIVETIQVAVDAGNLEESDPGNPRSEWQTRLSGLLTGPHDDLVLCYFKCTACSRMFRLSCETYHGGGGSWEVTA